VWGIYPTVVEHDNPVLSMKCMGFDRWITCAPASDLYLKSKVLSLYVVYNFRLNV